MATRPPIAWGGLATLIAGADLHLRECLLARAEAMRAELGGPVPAPVERLLVERVIVTWLQLNFFGAAEAQALRDGEGEATKLSLFRGKRQEQAQRAHLAALGGLTMYQKLLPTRPAVRIEKTPGPVRESRVVVGHDVEPELVLPPIIQDRLTGLYGGEDDEARTGRAGRPRRAPTPVAAEN